MQITYRKLKPLEAPDFRRVRLESLERFPEFFGTAYEDEAVKPKLFLEAHIERDSPDVFCFGAFTPEGDLIGLVGFIRADRVKTRHHGEISSMYVNPDFHGRKIGENILLELLKMVFAMDGIESVELTVFADNAAAVRLYEKIGFETSGIQKNYFKIGDKYWDKRYMQLTRERFLEINI